MSLCRWLTDGQFWTAANGNRDDESGCVSLAMIRQISKNYLCRLRWVSWHRWGALHPSKWLCLAQSDGYCLLYRNGDLGGSGRSR